MVALALPLIAPVITVNVLELEAAAIVTDAGTVNRELVFDKAMVAPPVRAAWLRVTVQVLDELTPMLDGLQVSDDRITGIIRLTVVLAELLP